MPISIRTDQPIVHDRMHITKIIADFWDHTSFAWRTIWGPHIHHGFYEDDRLLMPLQAQENLLEKILENLTIKPQMKVLDVGCGMGGTSLYLAKKYGASVTGITLSKEQIAIATQQALHEKVSNITFQLDDALSLSQFNNESFDVVWSLESCEQFFDKDLFFRQAFRVLKPGGKFMLATWCSDRDEYQGKLAIQYKKRCLAFDLPYMPTIESYRHSLEKANFKVNHIFDWSLHVKKSWDIGISLAQGYSFIKLIKMTGWRGLNMFKKLRLMRDAFKHGHVRYGVFYLTK
jgi:tocopherol O-methyltransferase